MVEMFTLPVHMLSDFTQITHFLKGGGGGGGGGEQQKVKKLHQKTNKHDMLEQVNNDKTKKKRIVDLSGSWLSLTSNILYKS